jgi:hypothetical protein
MTLSLMTPSIATLSIYGYLHNQVYVVEMTVGPDVDKMTVVEMTIGQMMCCHCTQHTHTQHNNKNV